MNSRTLPDDQDEPCSAGASGVGSSATKRRRRRLPKPVTLLLIVSLLANGVLFTMRDTTKVGGWRSGAAREAYLRAYQQVTESMPAPARQWDTPTSYGTVHVNYYAPSGSGDRTPVLLVPGWGAGIPMWKDNLPGLLRQRPVYALDALGDAGLSTQSVPLDTPQAQAAWISEALAAIKAPKVHVVGHSFGGWTAMNLALRHPDQVASVSLFDPVQTLSSLRFQVYLWSIPAAVPFLPQSWRDKALAKIGGTDTIDRSDPMTAMIDAGTKGYQSKRSFPGRFTHAQLRSLRIPVYAAMAGNSSVLKDPAAAVDLARRTIPQVEAKVWPGATHSLPMDLPDETNADLLRFMVKHDK